MSRNKRQRQNSAKRQNRQVSGKSLGSKSARASVANQDSGSETNLERLLNIIRGHRDVLALVNISLLFYLGISLYRILDKIGILEPMFQRGLADGIGGMVSSLVIAFLSLLIFGGSRFNKVLARTKSGIVKRLAYVGLTAVIVVALVPTQVKLAEVTGFCFGLSGTPADVSKKEVRVILTKFEQISGNQLEPHKEWEIVLNDAKALIGDKLSISIQLISDFVVTSSEVAEQVSNCFNATILIWGRVRGADLESFYHTTARWDWLIPSSPEATHFHGLQQDQALFVSPGDEPLFAVHFVVGQMTLIGGLFGDSVESLTVALDHSHQRSPEEVSSVFNSRGIANFQMGNSDKALADLTKAIELSPNGAHAYHNRGVAFNELGRFDLAFADLTKAIQLNSGYVGAYVDRGIVLFHQRKYDLALNDLTKAIEMEPKNFSAYLNRASVHAEKRNFVKALVDINRAIELNPGSATARLNKGAVYTGLSNPNLAIKSYTEAIKLDHNLIEAYVGRGQTLLAAGMYSQAIDDFSKVIERFPKTAGAYSYRGAAYSMMRLYDLAIQDYSKVIELEPKDAMAYSNRGVSYSDIGQHEKGLLDLNRAIELDPADAHAYFNRGIVYYRQQRYKRALIEMDHYLLLEKNPGAYELKAIAQVRQMAGK